MTALYTLAPGGGSPGSITSSISASSPTLCPPLLRLGADVVSVGGQGNPRESIVISVIDRDVTPELNGLINAAGGAGVQAVRVKVVSSRADEPWDVVTLQQANASEGSFTGVINVSDAVQPGAQDDGIVRLLPGDTLQAIYAPALFLVPRHSVVQHVRTWINASLRLSPGPAPAVGPMLNLPARDVSRVPLEGVLAIQLTDPDQDANVHAAGDTLHARLLTYPPNDGSISVLGSLTAHCVQRRSRDSGIDKAQRVIPGSSAAPARNWHLHRGLHRQRASPRVRCSVTGASNCLYMHVCKC